MLRQQVPEEAVADAPAGEQDAVDAGGLRQESAHGGGDAPGDEVGGGAEQVVQAVETTARQVPWPPVTSTQTSSEKLPGGLSMAE